MPPKEINFTRKEQEVIDVEIDKLLIKGIITETTRIRGEYISTKFVFVFLYTRTSLKKKPPQVTPVHSTTRISSQLQPSAHYTAEIESTASSMTTI